MLSDLRVAIRTLLRNPAFLAIAVAAIALGIGANTAIFSIFNSLLLNPAGISEPERLVAIRIRYDKLGLAGIPSSGADFISVRDNTRLFAAAGITQYQDFNFSDGPVPQRLVAAKVSWQFFDVFGVRPIMGRSFRAEEDQPEADQVAVISYGLWRRAFGGDANIVGRKVGFNQKPYEIIGVMPEGFRWPARADLWSPFGLQAARYLPANRHHQFSQMFARTRPGISFEQANAGVKLMAQQIIDTEFRNDSRNPHASTDPNPYGWGMFAMPFGEYTTGTLKTPILILLGAVAFVLLIACANIAGLLLARASGRTREIAVRTALGAGRWHLIRQLLAESIVISGIGGIAGLALAYAGLGALVAFAPEGLTAFSRVSMDWRVMLFTLGLSGVAGLLFGLAPALQLARSAQHAALKEGGRSGTAGRGRQTMRSALVVGEVALALVLLVGTGLLLRSLVRLQTVNPGLATKGVMTGTYWPPDAQYKEADKKAALHRAVLEQLRARPGVESAALAIPLPFSTQNWSGGFHIEGRPEEPGKPAAHGDQRYVSPGYFETMGIKLLKGRLFTEQDRIGSDRVFIVDDKMAREYWPKEDPIGKRVRPGDRSVPWMTIVGVVGHVRHSDLGVEGKGAYYQALYQNPPPNTSVVVKTRLDPAAMGPVIQSAVNSVDPRLPVYELKSMDRLILDSLGVKHFVVTLLGIFAGLAMLLASLGLYGVISYSVAQRTQEIGIRMALGAERWQVLAMVLKHGMSLALAGVAIGAAAAAALTRLIESQLFQAPGFDGLTFAATAAILVAVALAACWFPARRATTVDPMVALRYE